MVQNELFSLLFIAEYVCVCGGGIAIKANF